MRSGCAGMRRSAMAYAHASLSSAPALDELTRVVIGLKGGDHR